MLSENTSQISVFSPVLFYQKTSSSSTSSCCKMNCYRFDSTEREPQTLSPDQIKCAREEALYVLSTNSMEEAIRIFTEGLQPVPSVNMNANMSMSMMMDWDEEDEELDRIKGNHALAGLRDPMTTIF